MRTWLHDSSETYPEQEIAVLATATVVASSEADGHPVSHIFDEYRGPGGTQWIAGEPGDQKIVIAFHKPITIRRITFEIEECEVQRTQELQVSVSNDGGVTYRELRRQEFTFSPEAATWECEDWAVAEFYVTHLRLVIRPDKGRQDVVAKLTSVVLADIE
jgi:F5/8 type C domain